MKSTTNTSKSTKVQTTQTSPKGQAVELEMELIPVSTTGVGKSRTTVKKVSDAKVIDNQQAIFEQPSKEASKIITDLIAIGKPKAKKTVIITTVAPTTAPKKVVATKVTKGKVTTNNVKITELESTVLTALIDSLYAEGGFSDVDCNDLAKASRLRAKQVVGVVSSLCKKGLVYTDTTQQQGKPAYEIVYLNSTAYNLHPTWVKTIDETLDHTITVLDIQKESKKEAKKEEVKEVKNQGKPYGKFGVHGHNKNLEGFKKGDLITFEIKGEKVTGEFVHFHINNHSPKGYLVISFKGKIYERVISKVEKVIVTAVGVAPKLKKTTTVVKTKKS